MNRTEKPEAGLIVGRNPVREALERGEGQIEKVLLQTGAGGAALQEIRRLAAAHGVPVQYVPAARLATLSGGLNHQGVAAIAAPVAYAEVYAMLEAVALDIDAVRLRKPILVLLDQLEDPYNFGAILRSAVAAGAAGVIVPLHQMAPLNTAAVKASAGMALRIPVARVPNLVTMIEELKERGYWVAGADGQGETSVWEMDWDRPVALVVGSEEKGLRPRVAEACDYRVSIPMPGPAESLNASVAAGILLFAAARVR